MRSIVFFCDRAMLPGLHVCIISLLKSLKCSSRNQYELIVFADGFRRLDKSHLQDSHSRFADGVTLRIQDYKPDAPSKGANTLHGNTTVYGRIYLADLLPESDRCLYLDSDLIVNYSVSNIFEKFDGHHVLVVDGCSVRRLSLDGDLYMAAHLDMSGNCFNSGVMGIDLKLWRDNQIFNKCLEVISNYKGHFKSADQALLNIVLADDFIGMGETINFPLYPTGAVVEVESSPRRIFHFVGSPKPWDFGGFLNHTNYKLWRSFFLQTAISNQSLWKYWGIRRTARISKSTLKAVFSKINSRFR